MDQTASILIKVDEHVNCTYAPKADITAFELATLLPYFIGKAMTKEDWDALGACQRHLVKR